MAEDLTRHASCFGERRGIGISPSRCTTAHRVAHVLGLLLLRGLYRYLFPIDGCSMGYGDR